MEALSPEKSERIPGWIKKVVPVLVSVGILIYYFHDQDWDLFVESLAGVNVWLAVAGVVVPQLLHWFFGALLMERYFAWFDKPIPFWKYFWVQGASYMLMLLHSAVGGGGILIYLQRKTGISWTKLAGMMTFRILIVLGFMSWLMFPLTLAMHYYGLDEGIKINIWVFWGVLIFSMAWSAESWIIFHHDKFFGITKLLFRDKNSEFMTVARTASKRQWLLTQALTVPSFIAALLGYYYINRAFNVNVPFLEFIVVVPVALLIAGLPAAAGGFGTTTVAWMTFFVAYGSKEEIAALSLFIPFGRAVTRAVIGLISMAPAMKEINSMGEPEGAENDAAMMEDEEAANVDHG